MQNFIKNIYKDPSPRRGFTIFATGLIIFLFITSIHKVNFIFVLIPLLVMFIGLIDHIIIFFKKLNE